MSLALAGDLPAKEPEGILFRQPLPDLPGEIFTEVELNGDKRSMFIDTGAGSTVVSELLTKSLKSEGTDSVLDVLDSEAHRIPAKRYKIRKLMLQSLVQEDLPAVAVDLALPSSVLGHKIDGVVGTPQLKSGKLFLNYDDGFLEVHSGDWKLPKSESNELDLNFRTTPSFDAMIAGRHGEFVIDTGEHDVIGLESSLFTALVRNGTIQVSNDIVHTFSAGGDSRSRTGWFLKGDLMGKSLKGMSVVSIGGADCQSAIGTGWLCAFNLEIDYAAQKLRFQKRGMPRAPLSTRLMIGGSLTYSGQGPGSKGCVRTEQVPWRKRGFELETLSKRWMAWLLEI